MVIGIPDVKVVAKATLCCLPNIATLCFSYIKLCIQYVIVAKTRIE